MIVRPKWDYCMKELFRNFIILKYFISDILDIPIEKIRSLKLRNTNFDTYNSLTPNWYYKVLR